LAEIDSDVTVDVQDAQPEEEIRICLFGIGEDMYAIPVDLLTEIIIPQKIFPVPTTPAHVRGVINLRGNILPIVEIRDMLSLAPPSAIAGQIVIIKHDTCTIGIVVDNVYEVTSVPLSSVLTIPADFGAQPGRNRSRFFKGIIQREIGLAALLNIERIFEEIKLS
jgi:purine-binding chemotaxis protein CheW